MARTKSPNQEDEENVQKREERKKKKNQTSNLFDQAVNSNFRISNLHMTTEPVKQFSSSKQWSSRRQET